VTGVCGGRGDANAPKPPKARLPCPAVDGPPPKIETRSSSGFVEVPEIKLAAAGLEKISVAAKPDGRPSVAGSSSKSSRFSACRPAATVCNAFCVENRSSPLEEMSETRKRLKGDEKKLTLLPSVAWSPH
jgi:hypothetical protein